MAPRTEPPVAQLKDVSLSFGGEVLFDRVSLALPRGARAALVGRNGAGKSTLMRVMARMIEPDSGEVWQSPGARAIYVAQEPDLTGFATLSDYVLSGLPEGEADEFHRAEAALMQMELDPYRVPAGLSGGEIRRAALARAIAADPDILLLDEPTNHLDIPAVEALEGFLAGFRGAALIVSHDRRFLETITNKTVWVRPGGVMTGEMGFGGFDAWAAAIEAEEEKVFARLETHIKAETHWLARGVTARRTRNEGRLARLYGMRAERARLIAQQSGANVSMAADIGGLSGRLVLEAKGLSKSFPTSDGPRCVLRNLDLRVMRGDRLGIIGPNGAGKSTLLNLLLGRAKESPDAGEIRLGANLEIAFLDQNRETLAPQSTLWDLMAPLGGDQIMVRGQPRHVAAYAKDFLFAANQLRQPVAALSGGERNRLQLALALAKPANLLVLDEPTNDLDIDTLELLEEMLESYEGTLIVVSHDRAFLDSVASSILWPLGDGAWTETPGGYADYERERARILSARSAGRAAVAGESRGNAKGAESAHKSAPRKLSFRDEHRLAELEKSMPLWEREIARLELALSDPALYGKNPKEFTRLTEKLTAQRAMLAAGEEEWLMLEDKKSSLARVDG